VILASQNKEKEGLPSLAVTRGRFVYHFATPENKAAFEKDPQAYEVQANGMCARMGAPVGGSPINYSVYKGKIYLFGSGDCREAFEDAPDKFIEVPEVAVAGTAAEQKRAAELIAKAVAALGGADKLDAMRSIKIRQKLPNGTERATYFRFPSDLRTEDTGRFELWNIVTDKDAFQVPVKMQRVMPMLPASAAFLRDQTLRLPHLLLRSRPEFQILGVTKSAEGESADVFFHGARLGILIDPSSGQVLGIRARGRTREGYVAPVISAITPENYSVELNPELPASLFERPVFDKK